MGVNNFYISKVLKYLNTNSPAVNKQPGCILKYFSDRRLLHTDTERHQYQSRFFGQAREDLQGPQVLLQFR